MEIGSIVMVKLPLVVIEEWKKMENKRKDKKLVKLWLTESEARVLKDYLKSHLVASIGILLDKVSERGDLE